MSTYWSKFLVKLQDLMHPLPSENIIEMDEISSSIEPGARIFAQGMEPDSSYCSQNQENNHLTSWNGVST